MQTHTHILLIYLICKHEPLISCSLTVTLTLTRNPINKHFAIELWEKKNLIQCVTHFLQDLFL